MGKANNPGCDSADCCGSSNDVCVTVGSCCGVTGSGSTFTLSQSGTTIGTCTTDGTGKCCINFPTPGVYDALVTHSGVTLFSQPLTLVSGTNSFTFSACYRLTVFGCPDATLTSQGLAGATVTAKDHTTGAVLASGTTDASGKFCAVGLPVGSGHSVDFVVSKVRFTGGTLTTATGSSTSSQLTLSPASGYICCYGPDPVPTTLYLTSPTGASVTMTYSAGLWTGGETITGIGFDAGGTCGTVSAPFTWQFDCQFLKFGFQEYSNSFGLDPCCGVSGPCPNGINNIIDLNASTGSCGGGATSFVLHSPTSQTISYGPFNLSATFPTLGACFGNYITGTATMTE